MIIALNQYWYLPLHLDWLSTDINLALSTGEQWDFYDQLWQDFL